MRFRELVNLLESCKDGRSIAQLYSHIIKTGRTRDTFLAAKLNGSCTKYATLALARKMFDETPARTTYVWNSILISYSREKHYEETLFLFSQMLSAERPDNLSVSLVLKSCAVLRTVNLGRTLHGIVKKNDFGSDFFVGSALVELYSKCGRMDNALQVFEEYSRPDIVLWTTMVTGYEQNSYYEEALSFFRRMVAIELVRPDPITLVSLVSACAQSVNLKAGLSVHGYVIRHGFDFSLSLANALLSLYAKTGSINTAHTLFRKMGEKDVISWSTMIAACAHSSAASEALDLFGEMLERKFEPSLITVINVLKACEVICDLEKGKKIHQLAAQKGFEFDVSVCTALMNMYIKCSSPDEAFDIFQRMPNKDVISWVVLLSGYVQNGMAQKAMWVFCQMLSNEIQADSFAVVKILTACSELGILQQALCLHGFVVKGGFSDNVFVVATLIELYSKCGSLDNAVKVFESVNCKDNVIWSSMISGYGVHGRGEEALKLFDQMMKNSSVTPNNVTFLSILSACSHIGLIEEGIKLFDVMVNEYQLRPDSMHYGILVDLIGRRGELDKAMNLINHMPTQAGPHVWAALLGACRIHQNISIGEFAARNLLCLVPNHAGYYILLSNMYAVDGKWDNAENLRTLVKGKKLKKVMAQSVLELRNEIHKFVANDQLHPDSQQIYRCVNELEANVREHGYVPSMDILLHEA
ncbi:hypothetical protein NMG60_11008460 [Bertholletia excelsa]